MKDFQPLDEILSSWERCMERKMQSHDCPKAVPEDERLRDTGRSGALVTAFESSVERIGELMPEKYLFLY